MKNIDPMNCSLTEGRESRRPTCGTSRFCEGIGRQLQVVLVRVGLRRDWMDIKAKNVFEKVSNNIKQHKQVKRYVNTHR